MFLQNLRKLQVDAGKEERKHLPNIVHNFSTYTLTDKETEALAYGLDHYIPGDIDKRRLEVEFKTSTKASNGIRRTYQKPRSKT